MISNRPRPFAGRSVAVVLFALALLPVRLAPAEAQRAPFPDLTFRGLDGGFVSVSDLKGRPVLVNFWATWCGPCRMELPVIQRFYERFNGRGLVVLTINTDARPEPVRPFLTRMKLSLPVYTTTPEDQARLGIQSIPTTFLIDTDGRIVRRENGYSGRLEKELAESIEKLLPAPGADSPGKERG